MRWADSIQLPELFEHLTLPQCTTAAEAAIKENNTQTKTKAKKQKTKKKESNQTIKVYFTLYLSYTIQLLFQQKFYIYIQYTLRLLNATVRRVETINVV